MVKRIVGLDMVKCIAAFFIVVLHWPANDLVGQMLHIFARSAVPLFFMITGFFIQGIIEKGGQWRYIKKIFFLALYAYLLYGVIYVFQNNTINGPSWRSLCLWFLTGENGLGVHLWYLNAVLFAVPVLCALSIFGKLERFYWLIPILFISNYIISFFEVPACYYRNFLFTGIPYMLLGDMMRIHSAKFSLSSSKYLTFALGSFGMLMAEVFAYRMVGVKEHREHFVMLIPLSVCLFAWGLNFVSKKQSCLLDAIFSIGRNYSQYIYIYHYGILGYVGMYMSGTPRLIVTFFLTLCVSFLHIRIQRFWQKKYN